MLRFIRIKLNIVRYDDWILYKLKPLIYFNRVAIIKLQFKNSIIKYVWILQIEWLSKIW